MAPQLFHGFGNTFSVPWQMLHACLSHLNQRFFLPPPAPNFLPIAPIGRRVAHQNSRLQIAFIAPVALSPSL